MREIDCVREVVYNGNLDVFIAVIVIVNFVGMPHGIPLLAVFVVLQREEARLIEKRKIVLNSPILHS